MKKKTKITKEILKQYYFIEDFHNAWFRNVPGVGCPTVIKIWLDKDLLTITQYGQDDIIISLPDSLEQLIIFWGFLTKHPFKNNYEKKLYHRVSWWYTDDFILYERKPNTNLEQARISTTELVYINITRCITLDFKKRFSLDDFVLLKAVNELDEKRRSTKAS